jgi:hypothetical protein
VCCRQIIGIKFQIPFYPHIAFKGVSSFCPFSGGDFKECDFSYPQTQSIARSLISVLSSNLRLPPGTQVSRHQLWLALPPDTCMGRVWDVVCLAAISALRDGWVLISVNAEGRPRCPVSVAAAKVLASFWSRLSSFCWTSVSAV